MPLEKMKESVMEVLEIICWMLLDKVEDIGDVSKKNVIMIGRGFNFCILLNIIVFYDKRNIFTFIKFFLRSLCPISI